MISGSEQLIRPEDVSPMPQHLSRFRRQCLGKAISGMICARVAGKRCVIGVCSGYVFMVSCRSW